MKIPKSIDIYGKKCTVKSVKGLAATHGCLGRFHYNNGVYLIELDAALKGFDLVSTFYHELFHAMFYRLGYKQSGMPQQMEEIMVEQMSVCLAEFFLKK